MTPPKLPELLALKSIIELGAGKLETRVACEVKLPKGDSYPVHVIAHLAEMHALKSIFVQTNSHHRYIIEPQSQQYFAHGDLWDHLYMQSCAQ